MLLRNESTPMDPKKSNKIRDIVRLQQILKKWKRLANAPKSSSIKFLKSTTCTAAAAAADADAVPKGYLAVCVGIDEKEELKRFVIPTHYLAHPSFRILLQEAEEQFGFHQQGVLQIPCHVPVFENILDALQRNHQDFFFHNRSAQNEIIGYSSPPHHPQMCT